jgi:hypothetical protein
MPHLSHSVSGAFRTFSYWMANGSVCYPCWIREPSALEAACAIFANVLMFDNTGQVNAKHAEKRAAQYIRALFLPWRIGRRTCTVHLHFRTPPGSGDAWATTVGIRGPRNPVAPRDVIICRHHD